MKFTRRKCVIFLVSKYDNLACLIIKLLLVMLVTNIISASPLLPACCAQSDGGGDHPRDNLNQTTPEILMKSTARL